MEKENGVAVVILAAGLGTRMKSEKAKVLHEIGGKSMISYVLDTARSITSNNHIIVVIGCQAEAVRNEALRKGEFVFAHQEQQLGTGHAVLCALSRIPDQAEDVVILCGDVPFISQATLTALVRKKREDGLDIAVLAVRLDAPTGYGRIVFGDDGRIVRIVEESDAGLAEKNIDIVNTGTYCVGKTFLERSLAQLTSDNQQNEFYLTDIVEIACSTDCSAGAMICENVHEVIGINSLADLEQAERVQSQKSG